MTEWREDLRHSDVVLKQKRQRPQTKVQKKKDVKNRSTQSSSGKDDVEGRESRDELVLITEADIKDTYDRQCPEQGRQTLEDNAIASVLGFVVDCCKKTRRETFMLIEETVIEPGKR